ncbi:MAG: sigma-70 family RNA polymerase sigma factor [Acidobacteria bacterium]|nr:sigma-70 family RNA polymerase sigma factor [Acidobacteriota bacterium]
MVDRWTPPGGPPRPFDAIFDEYGPALRRLAARFARARGDQDDLFQDVMVAVWRALPTHRGECSERTFVFRIAENRAISYLSRRPPATADVSEALEVPAPTKTPEQMAVHNQRGERLAAAVAQLPPGHREVVALTLEGLSYQDTADVLGITESNVGARLTRARAQLRQLLAEDR